MPCGPGWVEGFTYGKFESYIFMNVRLWLPGPGTKATRRTHYMVNPNPTFFTYGNLLPNRDNFWFGLHIRPARGVPRVGRPVYSGWIVDFGTCDRDVRFGYV